MLSVLVRSDNLGAVRASLWSRPSTIARTWPLYVATALFHQARGALASMAVHLVELRNITSKPPLHWATTVGRPCVENVVGF